jgi:hypothetical protein
LLLPDGQASREARQCGFRSASRVIWSLILSFRFLRLQIASSFGCGRAFSSVMACSKDACRAFNASMWSTALIDDLQPVADLKTVTPSPRQVTAETSLLARMCKIF